MGHTRNLQNFSAFERFPFFRIPGFLTGIALFVLAFLISSPLALGQVDRFPNQCFDEPVAPESLPNNFFWVTLCAPSGKQCFTPMPPELDSQFPDPWQANTFVIKATKPLDFDADVAVWHGYRFDPVNHTSTLIWEHTSSDGIPSGLPEGTVRFGAPGLIQPAGESGYHFYFRVTFCKEVSPGTNDKCTCMSESSDILPTNSFDGPDPDGTGPLKQNLEDQFRRPNTSTTILGGDGLGPSVVWAELSSGQQGRPIIIDQERVSAVSGSNMLFVARAASSTNSYSEALFRKAPPTSNSRFNVDITARAFVPPGNSQIKAYALKLVNEEGQLTETNPADPNVPEIQVRRLVGNSISASLKSWKIGDLDGDGTGCDGVIPLADDVTNPVWLRIELRDNQNSDPEIRGTIAWGGCLEDGGLEACSHVCTTDWWRDFDDPGEMSGAFGFWGFFVHHRDYKLENFRAGSAP